MKIVVFLGLLAACLAQTPPPCNGEKVLTIKTSYPSGTLEHEAALWLAGYIASHPANGFSINTIEVKSDDSNFRDSKFADQSNGQCGTLSLVAPSFVGPTNLMYQIWQNVPFGLTADELMVFAHQYQPGEAAFLNYWRSVDVEAVLGPTMGPSWGGFFENRINSVEDFRGVVMCAPRANIFYTEMMRILGATVIAAENDPACNAWDSPYPYQVVPNGWLGHNFAEHVYAYYPTLFQPSNQLLWMMNRNNFASYNDADSLFLQAAISLANEYINGAANEAARKNFVEWDFERVRFPDAVFNGVRHLFNVYTENEAFVGATPQDMAIWNLYRNFSLESGNSMATVHESLDGWYQVLRGNADARGIAPGRRTYYFADMMSPFGYAAFSHFKQALSDLTSGLVELVYVDSDAIAMKTGTNTIAETNARAFDMVQNGEIDFLYGNPGWVPTTEVGDIFGGIPYGLNRFELEEFEMETNSAWKYFSRNYDVYAFVAAGYSSPLSFYPKEINRIEDFQGLKSLSIGLNPIGERLLKILGVNVVENPQAIPSQALLSGEADVFGAPLWLDPLFLPAAREKDFILTYPAPDANSGNSLLWVHKATWDSEVAAVRIAWENIIALANKKQQTENDKLMRTVFNGWIAMGGKIHRLPQCLMDDLRAHAKIATDDHVQTDTTQNLVFYNDYQAFREESAGHNERAQGWASVGRNYAGHWAEGDDGYDRRPVIHHRTTEINLNFDEKLSSNAR